MAENEETPKDAPAAPEAAPKKAAAPAPEAPAAEKPAAKAPEAKATEEKAPAVEKPAGEAKATDAKAPAAEGDQPAVAPVPRRKVKGGKHVPLGIVHIKATFNNTIVSVTDMSGGALAWNSAGRCGFKGSRKSTAYAATIVTQEATRAAMAHGLQEVEVRVQGPGAGRESAVRAVQSVGLTVNAIKDVTPVPHNGCRPRKRRRV